MAFSPGDINERFAFVLSRADGHGSVIGLSSVKRGTRFYRQAFVLCFVRDLSHLLFKTSTSIRDS